MSTTADNEQFWIIFDTCTKPIYTQDLYNLLALPPGSIIRYEYRRGLISDEAVKAALDPDNAPKKALLAYAQWREFTRGDESPGSDTPTEEVELVLTRLAEVLLIPSPEGETFFFDLKLLGFPNHEADGTRNLLEPQIAKGEIPYNKWVCISENEQELTSASTGEQDENWQTIIRTLCTPPMQFSYDTFWRLGVPHRDRNGEEAVEVIYEPQKALVSGQSVVRQYLPYYFLPEGDSAKIELISYTPSEQTLGVVLPPKTAKVSISIDENSPISAETKIIDLRHYTAEFIKLKTKRSETLDVRVGVLEFRTDEIGAKWPTGPNLKLRFLVEKSPWRVALAVALLPLIPVATFMANRLWDGDPFLSVLILLFASIAPVAAMACFGKLRFP